MPEKFANSQASLFTLYLDSSSRQRTSNKEVTLSVANPLVCSTGGTTVPSLCHQSWGKSRVCGNLEHHWPGHGRQWHRLFHSLLSAPLWEKQGLTVTLLQQCVLVTQSPAGGEPPH